MPFPVEVIVFLNGQGKVFDVSQRYSYGWWCFGVFDELLFFEQVVGFFFSHGKVGVEGGDFFLVFWQVVEGASSKFCCSDADDSFAEEV